MKGTCGFLYMRHRIARAWGYFPCRLTLVLFGLCMNRYGFSQLLWQTFLIKN